MFKLSKKKSKPDDDAINIVVLQADGRQFWLVVDEINDTEEIVVKPLSKQLKGISCFAGATIMGDGKVALILDILGLAQIASLAGESCEHGAATAKGEGGESTEKREAWLLLRAGDQGRLAVPLSMVSRLEEFDTSKVERSGNSRVIQYRGEIMPLVRVSDALQLSSNEAGEDTIRVVVHSDRGRSVGLVVDEILDIVDQHVSVVHKADNPRLLGSAVIQQHVTDLLNVPELLVCVAGESRPA